MHDSGTGLLVVGVCTNFGQLGCARRTHNSSSISSILAWTDCGAVEVESGAKICSEVELLKKAANGNESEVGGHEREVISGCSGV
jgi:hypothetical protein